MTAEFGYPADREEASAAQVRALEALLIEKGIITSGTVLCGAVQVGRNAWIAPNSSVKEHCKIGAGAMVGLGSVVIRDVPAKAVIAGNPARILKKK